MITRRCFNALAAASVLASGIAARRANALAWPTHPVRIVVPFAAGGPTDVIARIVGERLSKSWDQQVLIENRPGGGTNIANELVARSEPDGHTVLMGGSSQAATRGLYPSLSYDPIADFAPVAFICSYSFFMFVPNSLPVKSVSEFIAYGKANKGKLTLASPGTGSSPHLCGELFKHMAGLDMIHVPYRGAAPAMNDLIPGRVHLLFSGGATLDNARSGQVQVLGYTGAKRSAIASNVPTIAESGVPGFDVVSWYGFFVPAKTPTEIITKMNVDMRRSPIRAFMDAWRRSVTRAGPTLPRVSAHFSGRKSKSGVASSSKPASVRRNERAGWISIARMPQPHEGHSKTRLPSLSAHSSRPAAPGLILHCQRPGDCQLKSCSALPHRSRGVGITNNG